MYLKLFLRSRLPWVLSWAVTITGIFFLSWILFPAIWPVPVPTILIFALLGIMIPFFFDYLPKRKFYKAIENLSKAEEGVEEIEAFLRQTHIPEAIFICEQIVAFSAIQKTFLARYKEAGVSYEEFIELWVHEIKTPLALLSITLENYESEFSPGVKKNLQLCMRQIEEKVQQVLFYARSREVSKDFRLVFRRLDDLCKAMLRQKAEILMEAGVHIDLPDMDVRILVDAKGFSYVLGQVIDNSIKYGASVISFSFAFEDGWIVLFIRDDGPGIPKEEIPFIFDKGFVGKNGRKNEKSTGMGLFISKNLCEKMGVLADCTSDEKGTCFSFSFPDVKENI